MYLHASRYIYIDMEYLDIILSGGGPHYLCRLAVGELDVRHESRRALRRAIGARAVRVDDGARDGPVARVLRRVDGRLPPGGCDPCDSRQRKHTHAHERARTRTNT
jgi:hypothetical protein